MPMAGNDKSKMPQSINVNTLNVSQDFLKNVYIWTSFYRKHIYAFVEDFMNIKLKTFQKLQLYILNEYTFSAVLASRGLGKSWITSVYILARCILYPNTQVVVAAAVKSQSVEIVEYIDKFRKNSDAVNREILYLSAGQTDPRVDWVNGSTLRIVASNDNARGKRANLLISKIV